MHWKVERQETVVQSHLLNREIANDGTADEPEWVLAHAKTAQRALFLDGKQRLEARLEKIREKEARQRKRYETGEAYPKRQVCWVFLAIHG